MRFKFIAAEKVNFPIVHLCRVLQVSVSGYYSYTSRPESRRAKETRKLTVYIKESFERSRKTYGSPRITADLKDQGIHTSKKMVSNIMKKNNLKVRVKRRWKKTTDSKHNFRIAENTVDQNFESATKPNTIWGADITYIPTLTGWLYLAIVIDFCSRKVVGYSIESHMRTQMVSKALHQALKNRNICDHLIHHSDRGSQYASGDYTNLLKLHGIESSMSRKGNCWDNAVTESFFATLKKDLVYRTTFQNHTDAKYRISEYIENFYNLTRRHSSIGNMSPIQFENLTRLAKVA